MHVRTKRSGIAYSDIDISLIIFAKGMPDTIFMPVTNPSEKGYMRQASGSIPASAPRSMHSPKTVDLLRQRRTKEILSRLETLPPLPAAAQEVLAIVSDDPQDISRLEMTIRHDPAMTAKLLKVANCAAFAPRAPIDTVERAIVYLGLQEVKHIALGLCVFETLKPGRKIGGISRDAFYTHAIATAFVARMLAEELDYEECEAFFTCGLLHDLGRLALATCFRNEWKEMAKAAREEEIPLLVAENRRGYPHTLIGMWLARAWKLPEIIVMAIASHHLPVGHPKGNETGALIQLADFMCHGLGMGILAPPLVKRAQLVDYLGLSRSYVKNLEEQLGEIQGLARNLLR